MDRPFQNPLIKPLLDITHGLRRLCASHSSWCILLLGAFFNLCSEPFGFWFLCPFFISAALLLLEKATSAPKAFKNSFLFFFGYGLLGLYWTSLALTVDFKSFFWLIPFAVLGIPFLISMVMAPSLFFFWKLPWSPLGKVYAFALVLVLFELARTYLFFFFPWLLFGYSLTSSPCFLQDASWVGIFGLSFLTVVFGAIPYLYLKRSKTDYVPFILVALCTLNWGLGYSFLENNPTALMEGPSLRLVQPNISQEFKWNPAHRLSILRKMISLSSIENPSLKKPPQIIIWPEAALPFFLEESPSLASQIMPIIPKGGLLITGSTRRRFDGNTPIQAWNSLMVLDSEGQIRHVYDKVQLVPFGEYLPFRSLVHKMPFQKITHGTLDFSSGGQRQVIQVDPLPPFLPLICFEISFPSLRTAHGHSRPQWMLTISNDAWFGISIGPYQHLHMAQVRAVEERLPLIRATNTGVSAVIDPLGHVVALLPLNVQGILDTKCPCALPPGLYAQFGNLILCPFILLFIFGIWFINVCLMGILRHLKPHP